ncbi:antiterminator Q family protein [Serratia quinivorans]
MLLEWNYIHRISVRNMGTKLGISHTLVLKRLQAAEGFIDGCLAMLNVQLEMDRYCQKRKFIRQR